MSKVYSTKDPVEIRAIAETSRDNMREKSQWISLSNIAKACPPLYRSHDGLHDFGYEDPLNSGAVAPFKWVQLETEELANVPEVKTLVEACESVLESIYIIREIWPDGTAKASFEGAFLGVEGKLRTALVPFRDAP